MHTTTMNNLPGILSRTIYSDSVLLRCYMTPVGMVGGTCWQFRDSNDQYHKGPQVFDLGSKTQQDNLQYLLGSYFHYVNGKAKER